METLICPQCGGQLDETHVTGDVVRCQYCATEFRVPRSAPVFEQPQPVEVNLRAVKTGIGIVVLTPLIITLMVFVFIAGIFYFVFSRVNQTIGTTINAVQKSANDAQTQANAIKAAANAAKEKANLKTPQPTPTASKPK